MFSILENRSHPIYLLLLCTSISLAVFFYLNPLERHHTEESQDSASAELVTSLLINQKSTLPYLGRKINLVPSLDLINEPSKVPAMSINSSCIILYIDDKSCTVCADDESAFANELEAIYGPSKVFAIVHMQTRRSAINYARLNNSKFPVFYDEDDSFSKENNIHHSPLFLAVNENGQIYSAHIPIVGNKELCEPSHEHLKGTLKN